MKSLQSTLSRSILSLGALAALALASAPAHAAETYKIDPVHSWIVFKTSHMGIANAYGFFEDFEGSISFDEANPQNSNVELTVRTASVDTNNDDRDKHLVGTDFFNATEFPTATFKSTEITKTGDNTYKVVGDLTLLGQTKPVTLTFQDMGTTQGMKGETRRGGEGTVTFNRTDFGMNKYVEEGVLGDETTLIIAIEGILEE